MIHSKPSYEAGCASPYFLSGTCGRKPIKLSVAPLSVAGVWQCDTRCDLEKGDGIIRRGRFRSAGASASVSLPDKLATEGRYSNHEFFLPGRVERQRSRGESAREGGTGNQSNAPEYQVEAFSL